MRDQKLEVFEVETNQQLQKHGWIQKFLSDATHEFLIFTQQKPKDEYYRDFKPCFKTKALSGKGAMNEVACFLKEFN